MGGNGRSEIIVADSIEKLLLSIIGCTMMDHRCCCFFFTGGDFSDISDQLAPIPHLFEFRRSAAEWIDDDDDGELSVSDIAGYVELIGKPLWRVLKG